jgi:hypothetical protein
MLAQKNITKFKGSDIKKYLILEGLDVVGQEALLSEVKISSLAEPSDGVWLQVWNCQ